ncbi:MAG: efflux RND transporter periplasmic adaptor subunit [Bacteroidales bacterium]
MKKNKLTGIIANRYLSFTIILLAGIFIGWLVFHPSKVKTETTGSPAEESAATIWTCSMHPQIRMDKPGKCPICAMDLIPLVQGGSASIDPDAIQMTEEAAMLARVETTVVSRQKPTREVRLYGKVQVDERQLQNQVSHLSGRIEQLYASFTGETIEMGQTLARIYSPEVITAQQELLEAAKTKSIQPAIYEAAKEKLRQWKLTDEQIAAIETSGTVQPTLEIVSNTTGVVMERLVNEGDYVSRGTILYRIADLSKVWVMFDAYESDLQFLRKNDKMKFMLKAYPGTEFTGTIAFIDPVIDPVTRVAKVRVEADNRSGRLKPEMFATGVVQSALSGYGNELVIPQSAVLWTGVRSVVYVKQQGIDEPVFRMREVTLGPSLGDGWVIKAGLTEGEVIVTNGTFSVDAAAQLEGKPSMMNREGGTQATAHDHSGMNMQAGSSTENVDDNRTMARPEKASADIIHTDFRVEGNCEMCKDRIETTALSVRGVQSATWDMDNKILHLEYNKSLTARENVQKAIAAAGHDNGKYRAPDDVYNNLPECCLYREGEN